ncbi:hypothetical protein, partial [Cupriavidus sp. WS]|uniref:hypothetical protein n=1 Tax=Cupriavidus sp. WS TaxID=1312922 RepID=UPI001E5F6DD1
EARNGNARARRASESLASMLESCVFLGKHCRTSYTQQLFKGVNALRQHGNMDHNFRPTSFASMSPP